MKYFTGVKTVEELRQRYRELLKKYHPDNEGGSVEITQEINAEYDSLFAILSEEKSANEETPKYDYQAENDAFKKILNKIISYNMEIELIGNWIWCFDCFAYKDRLKELGFKFASKKKAWTWHYGDYVRYSKGEITFLFGDSCGSYFFIFFSETVRLPAFPRLPYRGSRTHPKEIKKVFSKP